MFIVLMSNTFILVVMSLWQALNTTYNNITKHLGLLLALGNLFVVLVLYIYFNANSVYSQLGNSSYAVDGLVLPFLMLTAFLMPLTIISNWNIKNPLLIILLTALGLILQLNFTVLNQISFYVYFEVALIPLFILVGIFGAKNRITAAYYVLIYTLASSLFMLLSISLYNGLLNTTDFYSLSYANFSLDVQSLLWILAFVGIAVKTPIMPVHTWLPVVHSESPLSGSVLLAGVVLKLAIFAIFRLLLPTLELATLLFVPFIMTLAVITIFWSSLVTLRQTDMKVLIAYSSISHMAVCIIAVLANSEIGLLGGIMLGIAHGLVSPALFIAVGGILYDRYHQRLVWYYQGLNQFMPIFTIYLVIFSLANIGTPLTANFIGELMSFVGAFNKNVVIGSLAVFSVLLSAAYQMRLTNRLTGGIKSASLDVTADLTRRETFMMLFLLLPTIYLGICPDYINNICSASVHTLLFSL